jgi:hypothetical protein
MNELPCSSCGQYFPMDQLSTLIHRNDVNLLCQTCVPVIKDLINEKVPKEIDDRS